MQQMVVGITGSQVHIPGIGTQGNDPEVIGDRTRMSSVTGER